MLMAVLNRLTPCYTARGVRIHVSSEYVPVRTNGMTIHGFVGVGARGDEGDDIIKL